MIIRIVGEGQWQVPDTEMGHLNRIDARVEHAIGTTSQNELTEALTELVTTVRTVGTPIADDNIIDSDLIVPDVSATIEEVSVWLSENPAATVLYPVDPLDALVPLRAEPVPFGVDGVLRIQWILRRDDTPARSIKIDHPGHLPGSSITRSWSPYDRRPYPSRH